MKKRVKYCDALRFIAIILIVIIHIMAFLRDKYVGTNKTYYFLLTLVDSFTRVGVPLFFMITGAFNLSRKKNIEYKNFVKQFFFKLFVPFFSISMIYYIINRMFFNYDNLKMSAFNFFKCFFNGKIEFHFWFMYDILLIYLLIPFLNTFIQKLSKKNIRMIIIIIYLFGNVLKTINTLATKYKFLIGFSSFTFPSILIDINYLFLGYYLYNYNINNKTKKIFYILSFIFIALMPLADIAFIDNSRNDFMLTVSSLFPIVPSIGIFTLFKDKYDKMKILKKLEFLFINKGNVFFYIYMTHVMVLKIVEKNLAKIFITTRLIENLALYFIIFLITFIISYLISIIIDKLYMLFYKKIMAK